MIFELHDSLALIAKTGVTLDRFAMWNVERIG